MFAEKKRSAEFSAPSAPKKGDIRPYHNPVPALNPSTCMSTADAFAVWQALPVPTIPMLLNTYSSSWTRPEALAPTLTKE